MSVSGSEPPATPPQSSPAAGQPPAAQPPGPQTPVRPTRGPNEIPLGVVLLAVLIGLALVGQDHWRRGLLLASAGLLTAAVLRLVLPARLSGLLVVRGRLFDVVVLSALGLAVLVLTSSVPLPPGSG